MACNVVLCSDDGRSKLRLRLLYLDSSFQTMEKRKDVACPLTTFDADRYGLVAVAATWALLLKGEVVMLPRGETQRSGDRVQDDASIGDV